jgi:hypothetical protein
LEYCFPIRLSPVLSCRIRTRESLTRAGGHTTAEYDTDAECDNMSDIDTEEHQIMFVEDER